MLLAARYSNKHTLSLFLLHIRLIYLSTLFTTMAQNIEEMYHLSNYDIIIALIHSINLK